MKKITLLIITLILFMIPAPVFSAITLDNGDKIRGDASTAAVVDYVISGMAGSTLSQLADGQLADATGDLYTASAAVIINSIILVNTDTSARTVNLFLLPSAGTARRIFPKDLSLAPGYAAFFDGTNIKVITTAGVTLSNGNIDLASPGPIGGTTPAAGAFTGLAATTYTAGGTVTDAELAFVGDVTDLIQGQLDLKAPLASPTFTGTVVLPSNQALLGSPTFVTSILPAAAGVGTVGSVDKEIAGIYLGASGVIYGEADQSNTLTSSATGWTANLNLASATLSVTGAITNIAGSLTDNTVNNDDINWADFEYIGEEGLVNDFLLSSAADAGDQNITSNGILYGLDNLIYVDLHTDATLGLGADTVIFNYTPLYKIGYDAAAYLGFTNTDAGGVVAGITSDGADTFTLGDGVDDDIIIDSADWAVDTSGNLTATSVAVDATATPGSIFYDSDCLGADEEIATIYANSTTTTDGTEDGEMDLQVMDSGTEKTFIKADADTGAEYVQVGPTDSTYLMHIYNSIPTVDGTWSGKAVIRTVKAGQTSVFGQVLHVDTDGELIVADADVASAGAAPGIFMALEAGTGAKLVLEYGYIFETDWDWTPGAIIYLDDDPTENEGLTAVAGIPATAGDQVQVLGVAISADVIKFDPSLVLVEVP